MDALTFWKVVTRDASQLLERLLSLLDAHGIRYCVIDGQAVNAYVDPLVTLDLDLVVAAEQLVEVEGLLASEFVVERFPHSPNVSAPNSDLRVRLQLDPRYAAFVARAVSGNVLGLDLPVATAEDVLAGKIWAVQDPTRRPSKRQKDLADIARMIEALPELRAKVPAEVLARLEA